MRQLAAGIAAAYDNRGIAYYKQGEFDKAISDYNEAIRLDPNDAAAYDNRGIAYRRADDHKKANADFVPARRLKAGQQEGRIVPSPILRPPNALRQATSK